MPTALLSQCDILEWAATYDGPPFHALLCDPPYHLTEIAKRFGAEDAAPAQFGADGAFQRALGRSLCPLYLGIGATVTSIAEGDEVGKVVRLLVAVKPEHAERLNVVNVATRAAAVLTGVIIALQGLPSLCLPVRAAIVTEAKVLRMVQAVAVCISAIPRAVLAAAFSLAQHTLVCLKRFAAIEAYTIAHWDSWRTGLNGGVLAYSRTILAASVVRPTGFSHKPVATVGAGDINAASIYPGVDWLTSQHCNTFALV